MRPIAPELWPDATTATATHAAPAHAAPAHAATLAFEEALEAYRNAPHGNDHEERDRLFAATRALLVVT